MRQLLPVPIDPVDPRTAYDDVPAGDGRPWVRLSMIASLDGAIAVDGLSGGLGGPGDRRVYLALRGLADVVLVAAGTVRTEGYGPAVLAEDVVAERRRQGRTPVPAIAVVSRSCRLDWDSPLFTAATVRPIVVTVASAPTDAVSRASAVADVIVAGAEDVDLSRAIAALGERGCSSVLAEGGPSLNGQLAAAGLLDELCLTLSPRLVSGEAKRILTGAALPPVRRHDLHSVCEEDGFLFLRYRAGERPSTSDVIV